VGVDDADRLAAIRRRYDRGRLQREDLGAAELAAPVLAVRRWLAEAVEDGREAEPTAMVLATVDTSVEPSRADARVVLCKGVDDGVVFYSNRTSAKGRQLEGAPDAAVVFRWAALERQVRCRGPVTRLADERSDEYFATRPRGSQIGAWASSQSAPVADRAALDDQAAAAADRFDGREVPRPPAWGGYRLVPREVELWQGRPDRLHDRLLAVRTDDGWTWTRLQP
jgi:pyridoxamine 5'-phosphate oxidase